MIRKEYIVPEVAVFEMQMKSTVMLEMSLRDEETETEWSQKRRANGIWEASDGGSLSGTSGR